MNSIIASIYNWFAKAKPTPLTRDFQVQLGVHLEEVQEMMATVTSSNTEVEEMILKLGEDLLTLSRRLKQMDNAGISLGGTRIDFLDSLCDQSVTATGLGYFQHMQVAGAVEEVDRSNYSKFVNGEPIFDEFKKIAKGPDYHKPDLVPFV